MVPIWKKYLSYLTEIHIESAPSDINPHLYVSMQSGILQLSTENAIYSYGENYHNFAKTFTQLDLAPIHKKEILILGFGLGSIPVILEKSFGTKAYYTGIELDENVLYLFDKYVGDSIESPIQLICADAQIYTATCQQKYKLICSDIFLDNEIPDSFYEVDYLQNVARIVESDGLVILNTLALTKANQYQADVYFEQVFKKVFPQAIKLEVHHNYMLLSHKAWLREL